MKKQTIASLTKKGLSQMKIALTLHIRKSKVVAEQKRLKVGKRVASKFWSDVKGYRKLLGGTRQEAIYTVKRSSKWVNKRWMRMSKKRREKATTIPEYKDKNVKQTIIERYMKIHGYSTMNEARNAWERSGS